MNLLLVLCISVFASVKFNVAFEISDDEYARVPPMYEMDDYEECRMRDHIHCKFRMKLRPMLPAKTNEIWEIIRKMSENPNYQDHETIYRYRCIAAGLGQQSKIVEEGLKIENRSLEKYSLAASVDDVICKTFQKIHLTKYDYIVLYVFIGYLGIIISATVAGALCHENAGKFTNALSVITNWKRLFEPIGDDDYQRLKSMQGMKAYNMYIVIMAHTFVVLATLFRKNPKIFEDLRTFHPLRWIEALAVQLISTYFVISAWLLSNQVHKIYSSKNKLTLTDLLRAILYRYIRLLPALAFLVSIEKSNWIKTMVDGPINELLEIDNKACNENWWATLLLINNIFYPRYQCNCVTWYLADDFQCYVIALLLFYVCFKWKLGTKVIIVAMALFWILHAAVIYMNDYRMIIDVSLENGQIHNAFTSQEDYSLHVSLYANFVSYGIGLLFGMIYFKYKHVKVPLNKMISIVWMLLFIGLPCLAATICMYEFSSFAKAAIGASLKPIFATGVAVGILGMSFNIGGTIKSIFETRYLEIAAKIGYCVYISHLLIIYPKQSLYTNIMEITGSSMAKNFVGDITACLLLGLALHLFIEKPSSNIWKIMIGTDRTPTKVQDKIK